ncbi:MAG: hypothetical protein L3J49_05720, partial [Desulfobulbaceae bacterium]|nr:hypothetical protein [Desulfobulbaceae bacterium]
MVSAEQMMRSGVFGRVVGEAKNIWSMADEKTGELIEGVKLIWYGGGRSVQLEDPEQLGLIHEGDFVTIEVPLSESKGAFKFGKGKLVELNGKPIGSSAVAKK